MLMLALLIAWSMYKAVGDKIPTTEFDATKLLSALRESMWEMPLPFILVGGIYSGYFAVSEAAAVAVLYVLIVDVLILREITIRRLPELCVTRWC